MRNLIAVIYYLLAMFGCEGGTTIVSRSVIDGVDVIHSKTRIMADVAHFECIASASGECHYTLFPRRCAPADGDCASRPIERFTMAAGATREVVGLPGFNACVTQADIPLTSDCKPPQSGGANEPR